MPRVQRLQSGRRGCRADTDVHYRKAEQHDLQRPQWQRRWRRERGPRPALLRQLRRGAASRRAPPQVPELVVYRQDALVCGAVVPCAAAASRGRLTAGLPRLQSRTFPVTCKAFHWCCAGRPLRIACLPQMNGGEEHAAGSRFSAQSSTLQACKGQPSWFTINGAFCNLTCKLQPASVRFESS